VIDTRGYVSVAEAAERLKLSPAQVRRRLRDGRLKGERVGHQWFVAEDGLKDEERFRPLIPPDVIEEIKQLRREINRYNHGKPFDVVEMLRESRESR
jgi:excisionase family DNA binding protein